MERNTDRSGERSAGLRSMLVQSGQEAIGQRLGLTTANVRVLRHRALASLRDCLGLTAGGTRGAGR